MVGIKCSVTSRAASYSFPKKRLALHLGKRCTSDYEKIEASLISHIKPPVTPENPGGWRSFPFHEGRQVIGDWMHFVSGFRNTMASLHALRLLSSFPSHAGVGFETGWTDKLSC